ncbi:ABC transporter ATP-binding protein [Herbaspirillum sp. SJZ107]|uniref:ABC transporter ATP-binding protein n=1 Tax=Herbaspirillum sp. SJZ107 TaxID=2572881 RepID=UPI001151537F|nr:ABC transporter ATP-binding protein [Herbaspirillum sp. SJZ107]TQK02707.1 ABC-2 type transport system ATP-binding protein [Herbaspirillum sp. SJZ107]
MNSQSGFPSIEMSSVSKHFGSQRVLDGLDWQVARGQVVGLLGRNGAGKSTLLECMLGLRELDGGSVAVLGEDAGRLSEKVLARIGYVPQKPDLFDWLTPLQMLDYFKAMYPRWNTGKVEGLLSRWGFDAAMRSKQIKKLSGGEQQRLAIIRALAHDPDLLILDEPVSALDPVGRREFLRELVEQVIERGTTVVFSTHILSDLERVAFDLAFLKNGKIALQGQTDALLEGARRILVPVSNLPAAPLAGEVRRHQDGAMASVIVQAPNADVERLAREPGVRVEALTLEDLFIEVTK